MERKIVTRHVLLVVVVLAAGSFVASCGGGAEVGPVSAENAVVSVAFDGETCSWEGPTLIEQGTLEVSVANSADFDLLLVAFRVQPDALSTQLERTPVGTDRDVPHREAFSVGEMTLNWWVSSNESFARGQLLVAGDYLFDCLTGTAPEHVWRAASVEIVAP